MDVPPRHNLLTIVSIAVVACAAADVVHEALGHGLASWLVGDPILSLSTVALQNATPNRLVAACGTTANVIVGALALFVLRRARGFTPWSYFLWLVGAFNLFNSGYLAASALLGNGDWAAVIAGLAPPAAWRAGLGLAGLAAYVIAVRWAASTMFTFVDRGEVAAGDLRRLTLPAYLASGVLMTVASVFNPISPSLILLSGVGASFGLNCGLLFVPGMTGSRRHGAESANRALSLSLLWAGLAVVTVATFVAVLGRGIRFAAR
jgi:hypothetical protein